VETEQRRDSITQVSSQCFCRILRGFLVHDSIRQIGNVPLGDFPPINDWVRWRGDTVFPERVGQRNVPGRVTVHRLVQVLGLHAVDEIIEHAGCDRVLPRCFTGRLVASVPQYWDFVVLAVIGQEQIGLPVAEPVDSVVDHVEFRSWVRPLSDMDDAVGTGIRCATVCGSDAGERLVVGRAVGWGVCGGDADDR